MHEYHAVCEYSKIGFGDSVESCFEKVSFKISDVLFDAVLSFSKSKPLWTDSLECDSIKEKLLDLALASLKNKVGARAFSNFHDITVHLQDYYYEYKLRQYLVGKSVEELGDLVFDSRVNSYRFTWMLDDEDYVGVGEIGLSLINGIVSDVNSVDFYRENLLNGDMDSYKFSYNAFFSYVDVNLDQKSSFETECRNIETLGLSGQNTFADVYRFDTKLQLKLDDMFLPIETELHTTANGDLSLVQYLSDFDDFGVEFNERGLVEICDKFGANYDNDKIVLVYCGSDFLPYQVSVIEKILSQSLKR